MKRIIVLALLSLVAANIYALDAGVDGHKKGDVVALKTEDEIAMSCDFSKQIINMALNTLCVYNGNH